MYRVLHFANVINRHDFIDTVVRNADRAKFEMMACTLSSEGNIEPADYPAAKIPFWVLPGGRRLQHPLTALLLARLLRRERVDVLHTHHYEQALVGWLATRLHPKTRLVIGRHYSDAVYRLPLGGKRKALLAVEQAANRAAARIIVPSTYIREILTERQGIEPGKIDLIPYGFEPRKYSSPSPSEVRALRETLGPEGAFVLGTFARLHEEKGHRFLLEALAALRPRLPHLRLLLLGEGPERASIERQIEAAGLGEAVSLLGWRGDAIAIMAAVDAVVQPTLQEAFSQAMVEALWMSKPLIITDVSGATDIIRDGENGLLVPRGDAPALAASIEKLAGDAALRSRLGEAGRRYVEEHLVIGKIIHQYECSYLQAAHSETR